MKGLFPKIALLEGSVFTIAVSIIVLAGYAIFGGSHSATIWLAMVFGLLTLAALTYFSLKRRVLEPLKLIQTGLRTVANGNFNHRLHIHTDDELSDLAQAFNQMASQLQDSHEHLSMERGKTFAALEASRDAIWVSDSNQKVAMVNSALERLTGRSREDLIGQSCYHLFGIKNHADANICDTACPFKFPDRQTGSVEGCLPTIGNKSAWVDISYGQVRDEDDRLRGVVHIVHDLTERKEIELVKDEFISMVSHEMRTPLHHIKGFTTTLLQTDIEWDQETERDFLESINREADRLSDLVEKTLHLSRLEDSRFPRHKEWISPHDIVDIALLRMGPKFFGREVHVDIPEDMPRLFVEAREIETVMVNLIENAVKYSEPETSIWIKCFFSFDYFYFQIRDQGDGIPAGEQEKIFDRFYRCIGSRGQVGGTGLGLAICKRIVEAHHGRIWLESTPGEGSVFSFCIPVLKLGEGENESTRTNPGRG